MFRVLSRFRPIALAFMLAALNGCSDALFPTESGQRVPTFVETDPHAAVGDIYMVTNTNDNGVGSLRWALSFATGGEIIRFDPALAGQTITVDSTIYTYKPYTIEGPADKGITLSGGGKVRVLMSVHSGVVTIRNVTVRDGRAPVGDDAGAIKSVGNLVLDHVSLIGNIADGRSALLAAGVTITNSTISGNTSTGGDAATYLVTPTIVNSTIANNVGGGISGSGALVLRNSIIAGNGLNKNCDLQFFTVTYEGENLSDDSSCGGPSDMLIADAKLGGVADNGGPTQTQALLVGSPAINAGSSCSVQVDQRYAQRDAQCDLGAYEFADFTAVTITIDPSTVVNQTTGWAVLTGTITCSRNETFSLALELHQTQRVGRVVTDVHAAATEPIACTTIARPWSASMVLTDGAFQNGSATATAQTLDAEPWVASAAASSEVKLYRSRK
jgi:hypothetical protein